MTLFVTSLLLFLVLAPAALADNPTQAQLDANDNQVLQLALTLEMLDSAFFNMMQVQYNRSAFAAIGMATTWDALDLIRLQEIAHGQLLNATLIARTGAGLAPCNYNFNIVTNIYQYMAVARVVENVGTAAYDGAISSIYNRSIQTAAATIATVEGRHAAFLNTLPGNISLPVFFAQGPLSPFPNATEVPFAPATVQSLISGFITSCPGYNVATILPTVIVVVPVAPPAGSNFPINNSTAQIQANDLAALNFALTLELLESTFYNTFYNTPSGYGLTAFLNNGLTADDFTYFGMITAHENIHVNYLQTAIKGAGGTPVTNCTYTFAGVTSFATFLSTSLALESTGVTAYDGAVNTIFDPATRQAAATIATIEARHTAYLSKIQNATTGASFPSNTDTAVSPAAIIAKVTGAGGFITACPAALVVPQSLVVNPYPITNASLSTTGAAKLTSGQATAALSTTSVTTSGAAQVASLFAGFFMSFALLFL